MNWKYIVGIVLGAGLLYFAFRDMDFELLKRNLRGGDYSWLVASLVVSMFSHYARAWRWRMLVRAAGRDVKVRDAFAAVLVGYMANAGAPRMGEIVRCTVLTTKTQTPFTVLAGTVFTERAIDVLTLMLLILLAFLLEYSKLVQYFLLYMPDFSLFHMMVLVILGLGGLFLLWKTQFYWRRFRFWNKLYELFREIGNAALSVRNLENVGWFFISTLVIWFCYAFSTYLGSLVLENTRSLGFELAFIVMVMGGIGMTIPVPGGLGPFHNAVIWTLVAFGFAKSDGEALALLLHTPQLIMLVVTGALAYFYLLSSSKLVRADTNNS